MNIDQVHSLSQIKVRHIHKETFTVMGIETFGCNQNNEIPNLWRRFLINMNQLSHYHNNTFLCICDHVPDYDPNKSEFSYMACIEIGNTKFHPPKGMITKTIFKQDYVVFTHVGHSDMLEDTYKYIYGTYFFKSEFELENAPDFELYDSRFNPNSERSEIDIYIPVKSIS